MIWKGTLFHISSEGIFGVYTGDWNREMVIALIYRNTKMTGNRWNGHEIQKSKAVKRTQSIASKGRI